MNNNAYPRPSRPVSFDLMARYPQPGDRSRRNDDRYLFLEALLSARKTFYLSYVGQSLQDNSTIPPSVVLSELIDYVEAGFIAERGPVSDHLIRKHPLQSFSTRYFEGQEMLLSYSEENYRAAQASVQDRLGAVPFISKGLSAPDEAWRVVSVDALSRFFRNPAKFLLTERLGLYLDDNTLTTVDREPFDLAGLERYVLDQQILQKHLSAESVADYLAVVRSRGVLPPGTVGTCLYHKRTREIGRFAAAVVAMTQSAIAESIEVDVDIGPFRLCGTIEGIFPHGLVSYRPATAGPKDSLDVWIKHLLLSLTENEAAKAGSRHLGLEASRPVAFEYSPILRSESEEFLSRLLACYWSGLRKPLHFFPESSWEYAAVVVIKGRPEQEGLTAAAKKWQGSDFHRGEGEDLYYRQCFPNGTPLDDLFMHTAVQVFEPLFKHTKKIEI